jgi:hypothetical protein
MNYLEELRWLIEDRWTPDPNGVDRESVPEPEVVVDRSVQEQNLETQDFVVVEERAGGDHERTLRNQRQKTFRASILARSANRTFNGEFIDGQSRLYGEFDETTRSHPDFGGMTGEIERILDEEIDGGPNYDIIIPDSGWARVESTYGVWAARIDVDLRDTDHV